MKRAMVVLIGTATLGSIAFIIALSAQADEQAAIFVTQMPLDTATGG